MSFEIDFEPIGKRVTAQAGETILQAAQRSGVPLTAVCGGGGTCGRCKIRVMDGDILDTAYTNLDGSGLDGSGLFGHPDGWHLACQVKILGDVKVYIPESSLEVIQRTQTDGEIAQIQIAPAVKRYNLEMSQPTLEDFLSDADRIRSAVGIPGLAFNIPVLNKLSPILRDLDFRPSVMVRGNEVIAVRPERSPLLGLAVDLGTTKLAGYLMDLESGVTLASLGMMNPQIAFGEDVMARISHTMSPSQPSSDGAEQLRIVIVQALNDLAGKLCEQTGNRVEDIADAVIVGNTAMHHLFLGLPVKQLGRAPYISVESSPLDLPCRDVGLRFSLGAYVHLLANIAGFVGADHVSMLLASDLAQRGKVVLGLDIGTNTEVSLVANGRHLACSTASGPAFEGAHIRFGMRAAPGAIEKVVIEDGGPRIKTIDDQPPIGLCGSGILDLIAQLRISGVLSSRGTLAKDQDNGRIRGGDKGSEYVLVAAGENNGKEIFINNADVNEIQLAKAAIRTGITLLLHRVGITEADIDEVVIAGAFGSYLDVRSGIEIGMFPRIDPQRYKQIGNAAGIGACAALLSLDQRRRAAEIAQQVEYVELLTEKDFSKVFARSLLLE